MKTQLNKILFAAIVLAGLMLNSSSAQINWAYAKNYGSDLSDGGRGIAVESNGDYYVTGYFSDTITFDAISLISDGGTDVFIAKFTTAGVALWAVRAGGVSNDEGASVTIGSGDSLYVTGFYTGNTTGNFTLAGYGLKDIFVHKLKKSTGAALAVIRAGSQADDEGKGIVYSPTTNALFITGYYSNGCNFNAVFASTGGTDIFTISLKPDLTYNWVNTDGTANNDEGHGICVNDSGWVFNTGFYQGNIAMDAIALAAYGGRDIFFNRYNPAGGAIGYAQRAGAVGTNDEGNSITCTPMGDVYATGYHTNLATFGGAALAAGAQNMFITRLTRVLAFGASNSYGAAAKDVGNSIFYDRWCNQVFVGGCAGNNINFGGGAIAVANEGAFVAAYTPAIAYVWARLGDGQVNEQTMGVASNGSTNVTATGFMRGAPTTFISATVPNINLTTLGMSDVWNGEVTRPGAGCAGGGAAAPERENVLPENDMESMPAALKVFPNPANELLYIQMLLEAKTNVQINIYSINGASIKSFAATADEGMVNATLNIGSLSPGMYILSVMDGNNNYIQRFVKQ